MWNDLRFKQSSRRCATGSVASYTKPFHMHTRFMICEGCWRRRSLCLTMSISRSWLTSGGFNLCIEQNLISCQLCPNRCPHPTSPVTNILRSDVSQLSVCSRFARPTLPRTARYRRIANLEANRSATRVPDRRQTRAAKPGIRDTRIADVAQGRGSLPVKAYPAFRLLIDATFWFTIFLTCSQKRPTIVHLVRQNEPNK
jgi:hypothetical protein